MELGLVVVRDEERPWGDQLVMEEKWLFRTDTDSEVELEKC